MQKARAQWTARLSQPRMWRLLCTDISKQRKDQSETHIRLQEACMAVTHLIHHTSGYIFRYCIPQDIQPLIKKRELRYSLKTGSLRCAKARAGDLVSFIRSVVNDLRGCQGRNARGLDCSNEPIPPIPVATRDRCQTNVGKGSDILWSTTAAR